MEPHFMNTNNINTPFEYANNKESPVPLLLERRGSQDSNLLDDGIIGEFKRKFLKNCIDMGVSVYTEQLFAISSLEEIYKIPGIYCYPTSNWVSILYINNPGFGVKDVFGISYFKKINRRVEIDLYGKIEDVRNAKKYLLNYLKEDNSIKICWFYKVRANDYDTIDVDIQLDKLPCKEMYPYFEFNSLEEYYNKFDSGNENILILIGPPGTGKTTFIRGLLYHTKNSCFLSYEQDPLKQDKMFIEWFVEDAKYLILEDADNLILPRENENEFISKFLNVSDGLVSTKNKKIIFSTNLKSINQIDSALLRPGRCFDVLEFRELTESEANSLARKFGLKEPNKSATVAEVFTNSPDDNNTNNIRMKKIFDRERRIGF